MHKRTPFAIFTYRRPLHTARALRALEQCAGLEKCQVTIYCDGPKSASDVEAVEENREIARAWGVRFHAQVVESDDNRGLAASIAGAVSRHVAESGRVIVLEDDLVPTPDFIEFMLSGLENFADADEVAQISGCLLPGALDSNGDAFFLPLTTTWGWATWQRAWRDFPDVLAIDPTELDRDPGFEARFTLNGAGGSYRAMLADRLNGANDSWGILWWFAVARAGKLVLYPRKSLIWNGGFDSSGTHCGGDQDFQSEPPLEYRTRRLPMPISMPREIVVDAQSLAAVRDYIGSGPVQPILSGRSGISTRLLGSARRLISRRARR